MRPVVIHVVYDFICPWCRIGLAHLKAAIRKANVRIAPIFQYIPYELNPDMPKAGISRHAYRSAKFGSWARSQMKDADVTLAGKRAGVEFNYDRVLVTPNSRLAHRLMYFVDKLGDAQKTQVLFEAIFSAYFSEGQDIGHIDVLVSIAKKAGFNAELIRKFLVTDAGEREVVAAELQAQADGVRAVPTIRIGGMQISGAQPVPVLVEALQQAEAAEATESSL